MKNSKSLKIKVIATVLASVCAVSAIGVVSVSANDGMGKSSDSQQRISYQNTVNYNTPFEYECHGATSYGYDWTYSGGGGIVSVSCNYNLDTHQYDFVITGLSEGTTSLTLYYNTADGVQQPVNMTVSVDSNLNVSQIG